MWVEFKRKKRKEKKKIIQDEKNINQSANQ